MIRRLGDTTINNNDRTVVRCVNEVSVSVIYVSTSKYDFLRRTDIVPERCRTSSDALFVPKLTRISRFS